MYDVIKTCIRAKGWKNMTTIKERIENEVENKTGQFRLSTILIVNKCNKNKIIVTI